MRKMTIKEYIINYAKDRYYFHISDLREYFAKKGTAFGKDSLKKCLYLLKKNGLIYGAGRGWYSTIKEEFKLDTKPIEKIITLIRKKFPLLKFSCWSTKQIEGFFHHLPSQFVTFVYTDKDFLQPLKDFLTDNGYNVYLNPYKTEAERYVELKNRTVILRPSISSRKFKNQYLAKIEKIFVDLFMEIKRIDFMDREEFQKVISNVILTYRIDVASMLDYAYNRKVKDKIQSIIVKLGKSTNATF